MYFKYGGKTFMMKNHVFDIDRIIRLDESIESTYE